MTPDRLASTTATHTHLKHHRDPIPDLLTQFSIVSKPVLWVRMLALSQVCVALLELQGRELGLELQTIDLKTLLLQTNDAYILTLESEYLAALEKFRLALIESNGNQPFAAVG